MPVARTALAALGLLAAVGTTAPSSLSAQTVTVDSLRMASSAGNDSTYARGDTIDVRVYFSSNTDVNSLPARLYLEIGTETRTATWTGPSNPCDCGSGGATWFGFLYVVQAGDYDANGITTTSLSNRDITAANGSSISNTALTGIAITNAAAHKVDGALGYPKVTGVTISSSAGADNTYNVDDTIAVTVAFDSTVAVTGTPQLALGIGSATKQANYASGTSTASLVFRYVVVAGDLDTDGISIGASALSLNGGTIRLGTKDAVLQSLSSHAITNAAAHKVDTPPGVTDVVFPNSPAEGDSLWRRLEHMRVSVHFSKLVWVTGSPRLALTIGANTRQASYELGSGSDSLVFRYRIEDTDEDTDGVSIGASALTLNSGTIKASSDSTDAALSLGSHAVSNAAAHKVDGITRFAGPVSFEDNPGADSTFGFGDRIRIVIYFNNLINPPGGGSVTLNVQIGTRTVPFAYTGVGPNLLSFTHYVTTDDIDADGLSLPENALSGSVSGGGRAAFTGLRGRAITNDPTLKVNGLLGLPDVQRASITSNAGTDSTYVRGDVIEIGVVFDENVTVTGTPSLALTIGANTRQARYISGSGGDSLTFRYATRTTDADANGISYSANALALNGGTIKGRVVYGDSTRNAHLDLKTHVVANGAAHKVDGSQGPPVVAGVAIASDAGADNAYVVDDTIEVGVVFVENVDVTGTPQLALTIGSRTGQASYASGTGGDSLTFRYVAVAGDVDTDGLSIGESALTLNGGTIRRAGSATVDANLGLSIYAVTNAAAHKVLAVQGLPHVTGTAIASDPGTDSIYAAGDTIEVAVVFNENVNVTGTPQVALEIGAATRQANYVLGTGGDSLTFRYVTVAADTDTTGISYSADALTLNGGTIRRVATTLDAVVSLLTHVITNAAAHKVLPTSNKVTGLSVNSAGTDSTFVRGDTMKVTLAFRETTVVTGTPRIRMWLGAVSRWATYHSGSGTSELEFRYVVEAGIDDGNGVGILADAVDLNGGMVRAANQVDVSVWIASSLTIVDGPAWKVAGSARITSASVGRPPTGNVFERGDTIVVTMVYSDSVDVTGVPTAWLNFASASHNPALYVSGTGTDTLKFRYVVQAADSDPDGLSLYGNAIQLTGGSTIREAGTATNAFHHTPWPYLGQNALTNSADHIVAGAERITSVSLGPPPVGDTFERGDTIKVIVVYSGSVDVTGVPTVWMNIGTNNYAGATYASGTGTDTLEFHRVVEATDVDGDGISIGGNALQLTGTPASTITDAGTNVAVLGGTPWGTASNAITNSGGHKVQGGTFTAAAVSGVAVTSSPSSGDTYELGERIEVGVSFNRGVAVTGTPQLALEIGSDTVQASYASGSGTKTLAFRYTVTAADADANGISIGASALALNGGTIGDGRDTTVAASLGLGSNAIADATAHKVDGAQGPPGVAGLSIGSPQVGDTFERGETIEVSVAFNKSVDVTGTPQLALTIGSATKQAGYAAGTGTDTLVFRYVVVTADVDADGLSIGSSALALNGGTIRVAGGTTDAVLGLGAHAVTNSTGHKVAGGTFTASAPSGVTITSAPSSDSTYGRTERIEVEVTFTRPVDVTGTPQLALTIDTLTRQASYASGSGTATLVFRYTVVAADADSTGISIGATALALNGGTIADARDGSTAAGLGLGSAAIANDAAHKVDGNLGPPSVTGVSFEYEPHNGTYERGEQIGVRVQFHRAVDVTGTPRLALTIGSATRQASYVNGTGTTTLLFRYTVVQSDDDGNGISIGASALTLNGGTIRLSGAMVDALLDLGSHAVANDGFQRVDGSQFTTPYAVGMAVRSSPASASTYQLAERIDVLVTFSTPVTVTGTPRVALGIGSATRHAEYARGTGTRDVWFHYTVAATDVDADGISIGGSALALNGGTINDARAGGSAALLTLAGEAFSNDGDHKVNGGLGAPSVVGVSIGDAPADSTFELSDVMVVTVEFNAAVTVAPTTGASRPRVRVGVGSGLKNAFYARGSGTTALEFEYTVFQADADADGISIGASALETPSGSTIRRMGTTTDAVLGLGVHAITNSAAHKVAGNTRTAPVVKGLRVTSSPVVGDTYLAGEAIEVEVAFVRGVYVAGTPRLALEVGDSTRQAEYNRRDATFTRVTFRYVVQATDMDADGISVGAGALAASASDTIADGRLWSDAADLALGSHVFTNAGAHKVSGAVPYVTSVFFVSASNTGISYASTDSVFGLGDEIRVGVGFSAGVTVAGTPRLALGIGSQTRSAAQCDAVTSGNIVVFCYTVVAADADTTGISIGANALTLPGGATIRAAGAATDARLSLAQWSFADAVEYQVDGTKEVAPGVAGVAITSAPASDSTYGRTEAIEVEVEFERAVAVTGTPQLALGIDTLTRQAGYASGSGTRTLVFRYVVAAADADTSGISVAASALALNGGTIVLSGGTAAAALGLGSHAVANARSHKVDGSLGSPGVTGLSIGSPAVGDVFERGETIEVSVVFHRAVDVGGTPQLALGIGSATRQAEYASGTGTDTLVFGYVVAVGDADADGLSIAAGALTLNGGTIRLAGGTLDAVLDLGSHAVANSAGHKVTGAFVASAVSGVTVSSAPASASTYELGESIEVKVAFTRDVAVTGTPRLALGIGTVTRQADYDSGSSSADTLVFGYAVRPADADADGLSIAAGALGLNGGTIDDARPGIGAASLDLGSNAIANAAAHKVNGGLGPPGVTGLAVAPPPAGAVFERGDTIVATVRFNKAVDVTGTPQLALGIGAQTRQAAYASGTGTAALVFRYVVATADVDVDGLSVGASALALNSGTIDVSGGTTDALLSLERHAFENFLVVNGGLFTASSASGVSISSSPASDSTYGRTERIEVEVTFARAVTVTGTPQLALTIGDSTRQASYASGSGTKTLAFGYVVVAADADANGLSIGPAALALNGGAIDDARDASEAAGLGLGSHAISNALAHKVNGSLGPPGVTGVTLGSPPVGTTFERGDTIVATLAFNRAVAVTGAPQLALGIGSATKQAVYASGSGTSSLEFRYVVVTADVDADGLSVATTALGLNGGTVRLAGGTLDATLGLGTHAISNSAGHKVAGGTFTASGVTGVAVASSPASGATYGLGERIEVRVTFARAVAVTGTPQLALSFGAATRQADYAGGTGTPQLAFGYVVVAGDADSDGLSIGASALALNGGGIADGRDGSTAAALGLGSSAVTDAGGHRVDATRGPPGVMGVTIGSPQVGDTFERGDTVEVEVEFNKPVAVTGAPQLALGIGAATKQAGYAGGSGTAALAFRYVVVSADADADGLSVAAGALALNGGTIKVSGGTADALLGLGAHAVANSGGHKVAGGTFTASSPSAASVTSAPASGDTYGLGERIEVRVTFARPVVVTGAPQLALGIGAATKQAGYAGGSGTRALVFGYVVASADADADGISVGASALSLNGGAIADARDGSTAAGLGLGSSAIANAGAHKVDGSVEGAPAVAGARLASAPSGGGSYGLGEEIRVAVRFDRAVAVTGTPELALGIGAATRQAGYASGSGTSELEFAYVVQAADADRDGISVGAGALSLSGGTLVVAGGTAAAVLSLGSHAIVNASGHAVAGTLEAAPVVTGARLVSSPANGSAYGLSERIAVALAFSRPVDVAGAPQLALGIGSATRQAGYASGSGTAELVFGYVVAGGDADADGVSVAAGALALNGGTIVIAGGRVAAVLSLGTHALSNVAGHLVDGSVETAPAVAGVTLASAPIGGGRYELGEEIRVHVRFDRAVAVTGSPQLALTIGAQTRTARFVRVVGYGAAARAGWAGVAAGYAGAGWAGGSAGGAGGSAGALGATQGAALEFAYAVQASDADADGISVGAGALSLNGGAITLLGGTAAAGLSLGGHALTNVGGHLVDGSVVSPPAVAGVEASRPPSGGRWRAGQTIEIAVVFDRPVSVTGGPRLALAMGTRTVHAALASASGRRVEFAYEVRPHDRAPNGIALAAGALDASGAAIVSAADGSTPAALSLGSHAFASDPTRRVEGGGGEPEPGRPPKFSAESYAFELAENVAGAVVVGAVSAVDPDEGDEVRYRLREGGGGLFEVDETSGEVSYVGAGEDYEAGPREHALVVSAADVGGLASTVRVTVKVTNANEAPAFERASWTFELAENAAGPIVLGTVSATDPDEGEALSYSLVSGGGGLFELDAASGAVRYVGAGEDYETGPREHALAVAVADAGGLRAAAGVVIAVADADEAPVFERASWTFELAENAAGPIVLGTVSATDPDEGEALSYSLVSGGGGLFELDAASGAISYVGAGEDYETGPREHALVVAATGADGLAARAAVVVAVADVNEAPVFEQASWTFELAENAAGPLAVGAVAAADEDEGDVLSYSLVSGGGGLFELDAASGAVRYVGAGEDYETGPREHALVVAATDRGGLAATANATVVVTDVNEAPEATAQIAVAALDAHGAAVQETLDAYFRDPDGDALAYAAESSDTAVAAASVAGGVLTIQPFAIGTASVTVTATDPGGLAAEQTVAVVVEASRSERARVLEGALAAFGRSLGAEAVDVIGGRLGLESAGGLGRSHLQLGGRSIACGDGAGAGAGDGCGWRALARTASGLLGVQVALPTVGGPGGAQSPGALNPAALLLGGPDAGAGAHGGFGVQAGGGLGMGGDYRGQQEPAAATPGGVTFNPLSGGDLLERSSFQLSLGGGAASDSGAFGAQDAAGLRPGWTVWGRAGMGGYEGRPADGLHFDGGRARSAHLGADYRFASGLLVGVAGARSSFETEFESAVNGAGSVAASLTSVHPYVHWSPTGGLGLWALAGAGTGDATLDEAAGGRFGADIAMLMGALGARRELAGGIALKADAFSVRVRSDDAADLAGVTARAHRVRLAPEVAKTWALGGEASLRTRLELGARLDAGDAETGLGAEAGGEASFDHAPTGLSVAMRGRALLAHQAEGLREWGAGVSLRLQPGGTAETGLSLSVEPAWGAATGATGELWRQGPAAIGPAAQAAHPVAHQAAPSGWVPGRMAMELGWGVALDNGATITPFGRWSQDAGAGQRFNAGARFSLLGQSVQSGTRAATDASSPAAESLRFLLHLYGEHASSPLEPPQRRLGLAGVVQLRQ